MVRPTSSRSLSAPYTERNSATLRPMRTESSIATAVAEVAFRNDLAGIERPDDVLEYIRSQMYEPEYASYVA